MFYEVNPAVKKRRENRSVSFFSFRFYFLFLGHPIICKHIFCVIYACKHHFYRKTNKNSYFDLYQIFIISPSPCHEGVFLTSIPISGHHMLVDILISDVTDVTFHTSAGADADVRLLTSADADLYNPK